MKEKKDGPYAQNNNKFKSIKNLNFNGGHKRLNLV